MQTIKRPHADGMQAVLKQCVDGWRVEINIKQANRNLMITGSAVKTTELAKTLAACRTFPAASNLEEAGNVFRA